MSAATATMHDTADRGFGIAAGVSGALHLTLLAFAIFGLPFVMKPPPVEDRPLAVEALPLAAITNAPPSDGVPRTPRIEEAAPPKPPEPQRPPQTLPPPPAQPAPPQPVPPPPPAQIQAPPPPEAPPAPVAPPQPAAPPPPAAERQTPPPPAPTPPQAPTAAPVAPPLPAPPPQPAPAPPPAPTPPQPAPPQARQTVAPPPPAPATPAPPAPQRPQQQVFDPDQVLRDLTRQRRAQPPPQPAQPATEPAPAAAPARRAVNAPFDPSRPLSSSEEGAIRGHIERRWNKDRGAKGIESFVVDIRVWLEPGGSGVVQRAEIASTSGAPQESLRAFADSARRAVLMASPLPMPAARTDLAGGNLVLTFRGAE